MHLNSRAALIVSALGAALAGFLVAGYLSDRSEDGPRTGAILRPEPLVGEFALVDQERHPVTRKTFEGRWSLLFMGFTHCPDVCPTTLALLTAVDARLRAQGKTVQTVFLSADPERDTPQALATYLANFGSDLIGVTGEKAELDKLCDSLGLAYVKNPGVDGQYTVDHSAALVLIDPQARVAAYFQPPHDADRLVADLGTAITSKR